MNRVWMALGLWLAATVAAQAEQERVISVTGEAMIERVPDMATLTIGVTEDDVEPGAALAATSDVLSEVIARLSAEGIAERDMQIRGLSLQPIWSDTRAGDGSKREITGFVASNSLVVRVRDLTALGRILDLTAQDGANRFSGLQFGLQDPAPVQADARKAAVQDAMARARDLAEAAGITLGPVLSITEGGGSVRPVQMEMSAMRSSADVPVARGEIGIRGQVSIIFAITE